MSEDKMRFKKKKKKEMKFVEEKESLSQKDEFWVKIGEKMRRNEVGFKVLAMTV